MCENSIHLKFYLVKCSITFSIQRINMSYQKVHDKNSHITPNWYFWKGSLSECNGGRIVKMVLPQIYALSVTHLHERQTDFTLHT